MTYAMARPLGYLGAAEAGSPAGEINGIATLRVDVTRSAQNIASVYGNNVSFERSLYEGVLAKARRDSNSVSTLTAAEAKAFILGVMSDVVSALVQAEQLALQTVAGPAERAQNHAAQAALIGPARIMLDGAATALGSAHAGDGASGLGSVIVILAVIAAVAVIYGIVGTAIVLVADSQIRMYQARQEAERICARGSCTPEQRAQLVHQLSLGPLNRIASGAGEGLKTGGMAVGTIAVIAGAGVLALGGLWFLFGTAAGRRTLKGIKEAS